MNLLPRMSRRGVVVAGAVALAACSSSSSQSAETTAAKVATDKADAHDRLDQATQLVTQMREKVPDDVATRTRCVVVVPSLVKAGVVVGGQSGKGYAACETAKGWSAPAPITIAGGTLGAQLGAQSTELLGIVASDKGKNALMTGNFRVGVDASATAGPVGTGKGTSTGATEGGDLVSYSRSKGLFAGANLDGTTIKADEDATRALYGAPHEMTKVLDGSVAVPNEPHTERFLSAVRESFGKHHRATSSR